MRRETATPGDPIANLLWIGGHQKLGSFLAYNLTTELIGSPSRMESQTCPGGDAEVVARDHAQHHGAGGKARAIDNHVLAGIAQRLELLQVRPKFAARVTGDAHGCR